jgi:hypothetical protein
MTWATLAHVGNDWFAVPLAVWTLVGLIRYDANPNLRTAVGGAIVLSAGLLTKAYFVSVVPMMVSLCALRRRWRDLGAVSVVLCGLAGLGIFGISYSTERSRELRSRGLAWIYMQF